MTLSSVCVYCGAASGENAKFGETAAGVGRVLAAAKLDLVYGGGRVGLMGRAADAAMAAGGRVIGIIPRFLLEMEVGHGTLSELEVVADMHERKRRMVERSDAFVILPGGLGTLDELVEVLTWKQLRLHDKPIVLVDVDGYWQPFLDLVNHMAGTGFIPPGRRRGLFRMTPDAGGLLAALHASDEDDLPH